MSFDPTELRAKYNPEGSQTRRMQERMLEIWEVVDGICKKHNLPYWFSSGSMLGAIRHQGFIPWDDDLDIEMFRPDFKKLMDILPKELPEHLALQWYTTDKNYFFQFAKVRDRNSRLFERNGYDKVWKEHGIWIDIFPVERVPQWVHKLSNLTFGHTYKMLRTAKDPVKAMRKVRALTALNRNVIFPILRGLSAVVFPTKYYNGGLGVPYWRKNPIEDYLPLRYVKFEDKVVPIMRKAEKWLTEKYGNYMQLPENPGADNHSEDVEIW